MTILQQSQTRTGLGVGTMTERLQWSLVLMGAWWELFSLPAILVLRDQDPKLGARPTLQQALRSGGAGALKTLRNLPAHRPLMFFLLGFLFYNDEMTVTQLTDLVAFLQSHYKLKEFRQTPYMPYP